jgi:EmrB/QacA subfamily drug resistance transporter
MSSTTAEPPAPSTDTSAVAVEPHLDTDTAASAPDPRRWLALAVISIAQLMVVLDATIVNIAMPQAQADLGISDTNRQWIVTAYALTFGGFLLLGGRIADYVGRKKVLIIGLLAFAAVSALGGLAQNEAMLYAARAGQGVAAALLAPAALAIITVTFVETHERAKAFAVYGAITGGGSAVGLLLGGVLTEFADWRWCLLVNTPIAIGAAIGAWFIVRESKAHGDTSYDVPGAVLVTSGLASLVYGFTRAADHGWSDTWTVFFIGLSVVLLGVFALVQAKVRNPLLPLRVVTDRNRGGAYLAGLLAGAGMLSMFLFLTYYFQAVLGYSALKAGFAYLPFSAGIILAAGASSKLMPAFGARVLSVVGFAMAVAGLVWLSFVTVDPSSYWTHVLPSMVVIAVGMGLVFVPLSSVSLIGVRDHDAGVASGVLNASQQIGGALGTALLSTVYVTATEDFLVANPGQPLEAMVSGYSAAFLGGALLLTLGGVITGILVNAGKDDLPAEGAVHVG